jgi:hypothetical protein
MPSDLRAPAAQIESRRIIGLQTVPSVEAKRAGWTFQPIRLVFPMRPQPPATDGFFKNEVIRILIPEKLRSVEKGWRLAGMGED